MIRDPEGWRAWESASLAAEPPDYERNLRWYAAMLELARELKVWPPADPLEGFDEELARIHRLHRLGEARR